MPISQLLRFADRSRLSASQNFAKSTISYFSVNRNNDDIQGVKKIYKNICINFRGILLNQCSNNL